MRVASNQDRSKPPLTDKIIFGLVNLYGRLRFRKVHRYYARWCKREGVIGPDLARPRTLNDKYYFRKAIDHAPLHVTLTDKYLAKLWVAQHFPDIPLPKTLWHGTDIRDLPDNLIGQNAVLKATHGSGQIIFLNKKGLTKHLIVQKAKRWPTIKIHTRFGEWSYSQLKPGFIVEEQIGEPDQPPLELKIYTFGQRIRMAIYLQTVGADRLSEVVAYDEDGRAFHRQELSVVDVGRFDVGHFPSEEILKASMRIGDVLDHARLDFYELGSKFILGEITLYNLGGNFGPVSVDTDEPNNLAWDITESWFFQTRQNWFWERYKSAYHRWNDQPTQVN